MTSVKKHAERSHRSYRTYKPFEMFERNAYSKRISRAERKGLFEKIFGNIFKGGNR